MSEVKRWTISSNESAPVELVRASDYDALKLARDTAEDRIVDLGNRCIKAEAERDSLKATFAALSESDGYFALKAEWDEEKAKHLITIKKLAEMWAERDKLAAECERLEAENKRFAAKCQYIIDERNKVVERYDKLAATNEPTFMRLRHDGKFDMRRGDQRGTQGHDSKGRRQHDPRSISYAGSDRRRAQRRKA